MARATQHYVDLGSHALRCVTSGAGDRHFTCLHGLVDDLSIWDRIAPALEERGRVLRIDQRGHGESGSPDGPYSRSDMASDVIAVLDTMAVERTVLVGHSMGGIMSMATALEHPDRVRGMVLIGTASQCNEKTADWYEKIARAGERDGNVGLSQRIYGRDSTKEIRGEARGIAHVTRTLKSLHDDPLTARLSHIGAPTLLLVGAKDPMGPKASAIIHGAFAPDRADLETLPEMGHWLHVQAPEAVIAALDEWLERTGI